MSGQVQPTVQLVLKDTQRLSDVVKWADLAMAIGVPENARIDASFGTLTVTAALAQTFAPEVPDEADE